MKENETNYGDFSEPKANKVSKRSEEVVLAAIKRCEQLSSELEQACMTIGKLNIELQNAKDYIDFLWRNKND